MIRAGLEQSIRASVGTTTRSFGYSASGNVTSDDQGPSPDYALTYNDNDRLASLTAGGSALASYTYDANEHRVIKTVSGGSGYTHHFMYDRDGHLIAESDNAGTVIREYLWLGGLPIGLVDSSGTPTLYFIHADHLATPQKATDGSKTLVWDAQVQPFGEIAAVTGALTQLLQFPGQYHDAETGFNDNWHRTYDPSTGRYLQADPLGIGAGPNVYAYAEGNPIGVVDRFGLAPGDSYPTPEAAARNALQNVYPQTIRENLEYAGRVYQKYFGFGPYSYTSPNKGTDTESNPGSCPIFTANRGTYHTHTTGPQFDSEHFSKQDKDLSDSERQPAYLGTPAGQVLKYTPGGSGSSGTTTSIGNLRE